MRLFVNNCFIFINIRIWLVWNYIFSNTWIVWVLIFPILIFFMSIFSTPLFGINLFWTAPASILLFPGVCSAGQPSAGWPKSSPGWENSCAALQPPLLPSQSPPAGQAKALLGPWVPPRTESSSRRRWLLPTQPPLSSPAPSSPSGGQPPSPSRWDGMARFLEGGSTNFGSGSELQGGGAPALQCQIYVYVLSLCKYIVKSGRKKYKFEDPVQPLLHNNEEKFDNKFRSQVYLIRCNSLSGGPMPPWM